MIDFTMLGGAKLKMEEEKKKAWTTPTLTVLVRRKPEEGILLVCKYDQVAGSHPLNIHTICQFLTCTVCTELSPS